MNVNLHLVCRSILEQTVASFPDADLSRLEENIRHLQNLDHAPKPLSSIQCPTFYYYVGLKDQPWWHINFMAKDQLIQYKERIKIELQTVQSNNLFTPFSLDIQEMVPLSYVQGTMYSYHITCDRDPDQSRYKTRQLTLPATIEFLDSISGLAEDAFFSYITPDTYIKLHAAASNVRLHVHLGLEVPNKSGIAVAGQPYRWPDDQTLCFDPSFLHEIWNFDGANKYILSYSIWHPDLTPAEIFAIKLLSKSYPNSI